MSPRSKKTAAPSLGAPIDRTVYLRRALKVIWSASARWTVFWFILLVAQGLLPTAAVYLTKHVVDGIAEAIGQGLSWEAVRPVAIPSILMGIVLLLTQTLQALVGWVRTIQSELVQDHIKSLIHEKAASIDIELYEIPEKYDSLSRANGEASSRTLSLLQNLGTFLQHMVTILGVAALLIPYGLWVPAALLISTLPALWVVIQHNRYHHEWWRENTEKQRWATYYDSVLTLPISAAEVRMFGLSHHFREAYQSLRRVLRNEKVDLERRRTIAQFQAAFAALVVTTGVLGWMVVRSLRGAATLGDIALFYQAFNQGQGPMRSLLNSVGQLYADTLFLEHLFTFLDLEAKIGDPKRPNRLPARLTEGIRFNDVCFKYPGSDETVLRNLNLTVPAGQTVALVGPNGAGKTTISKLLCRFYEPSSGAIEIDGIDIRTVPLDELRAACTVLFQSPVHFRATVSENIAIADVRAHADPDRVAESARAAGADSFVDALPARYDTLLGKEFQGGAQLSGGQWQRVALARAFYRDAPVVILDEPTSAMDSWAEMRWLEHLRKLMADRTSLIITHRFTTAMRADVIYLINDGSVAECGTHNELIARDGLYSASWRAQIREDVQSEQAVA